MSLLARLLGREDRPTCREPGCDRPQAKDIELTHHCEGHDQFYKAKVNVAQGVVEGEIAAGWVVYCSDCSGDLPRVARQEHHNMSPRELGECPRCGSSEVMFEKVDPKPQAAVNTLFEEVEEDV